ncbi:autophagy-related protein 9 [Cryptomeria japonica]|uniref:autophagy-related protein 9 n=1 Tax=Cryptomeria japonica TaxID=3369 RepID=UPI0027DAA6F3|nr:autophagy-related protein 9 [Cryptomeria japonica]
MISFDNGTLYSKCSMWLMKMFSERSNANAFRNFFKWPWTRNPGGASATVGLLSNVPPEIELSDYQPLPNGDIESPLDLLKGERQKVGPISDLDRFFERLYKYYCEHGLRCIVIRWIGNNVSLGFTIVFSGICLLCVDWHGLISLKCGGPGGDAVECDLAKVAFRKHPLKPFTLYTAVVVGYLGLFSLYWIFCFLIFFLQLKDTLEIRDFYQKSLNITDQELQRMSWSAVLEKTIQFQSIERLCVVKDLSAHDVVMRIMRKDNYLIGMLNKGVLALSIPQWVPGAGPVVQREVNGTENRLILTKTLEWSLKWCILQYMFDRNFLIRRDFINNPGSLRKRLMIVGFLMLVLCPFLVIFMLVYLFLMHAEQFYNHPSTALSRRWSNLAKWLFREFNELEHLFKSRLSGGIEHANDYVRQFPSPVVSLIAKHVSFVAGGLEAILIFIAILEESLLEGQLFGRNLLWYTAVLGAIIAISKSLITEDFQEFDHEGTMALVAQHSHHMPKSWRGAENSEYVRREFEALFQYTGVMLFEDMASLFVTPYILIFLLPKQVDAILQFIQDFTVNVDGVGDVCSLSVFDFELHGNGKYGSPCNTSKDRRSGQGKMEKSLLSFKSSYPSWEPNAQGKQFLDTLMDFRQQEQDRQAIQMYSPDRTSQKMPSIRGLGSAYSSGLREGVPPRLPLPRPRSAEVQTGQLDQPWTSDMEQKDHLYWLDRYYTLQSLYSSDVRDNQDSLDALQHNFLAPHTSGRQHLVGQREFSGFFGDDRVGNHMEASTSSAVQDSMFQEGTARQAGHMGESTRWWARRGAQSIRGYESFREPPLFSGGQLEGPTQSIRGYESFREPPLFSGGQLEGPTQSIRGYESFREPPLFSVSQLEGPIDELSYGSHKEEGMVSGMEQASALYASNLMKESSASYKSDFIDKNINALHFPYNNEGRDTIWAMKESSGTYENDFSDENSGLLFCDMPGRPVHTSQERMRSESNEIKEE